MVDTRVTHTKTTESCAIADTCHVHGSIPDGILFGTEAVYHMQHSVPSGSVPDMLQWIWQLYILQQQL